MDVAESPLFDQATLDELVAETSPELVARVITKFIDETEERLAHLDTALVVEDWATAEARAHVLKSSSASLGGMRVAAVAAVLDDASHRRDAPAIRKAVAALNDHWPETRETLKAAARRLVPLP